MDTNDVENAVWHFLCVAREDGVEKARAAMLKIGKDRRVPMMQVYELFARQGEAGRRAKAAAEAGDPAAAERSSACSTPTSTWACTTTRRATRRRRAST